jgi:hypothetical protein
VEGRSGGRACVRVALVGGGGGVLGERAATDAAVQFRRHTERWEKQGGSLLLAGGELLPAE